MNEQEKVAVRFSHELNEIENKLRQMESGRVYELSNAQMDGYLANNVSQLREMINDLVAKIDGDRPSFAEKISVLFEKTEE